MMSCPTRGNGADASSANLHQDDIDFHYAHTIDMDVTTLYACLWLRSVVFNGEQQCTEPDLDGRELEPHDDHSVGVGRRSPGRYAAHS